MLRLYRSWVTDNEDQMVVIMQPDTTIRGQRMLTRTYFLAISLMALLAALLPVSQAQTQDTEEAFSNLQVLPQDIGRPELNQIMLQNLQGLGLPRRQNVAPRFVIFV